MFVVVVGAKESVEELKRFLELNDAEKRLGSQGLSLITCCGL